MQRNFFLAFAGSLLMAMLVAPVDADNVTTIAAEELEVPQPAPLVVDPPPVHGPEQHAYAPTYGHVEHLCCPEPRLKYRNALRLFDKTRCRCGCVEKTMVVLSVPTECCPVEVPVCVPACCDMVPQMEVDRGLFGRCVYHFCWPNGYAVKVVERKHLGDYLVVCNAR